MQTTDARLSPDLWRKPGSHSGQVVKATSNVSSSWIYTVLFSNNKRRCCHRSQVYGAWIEVLVRVNVRSQVDLDVVFYLVLWLESTDRFFFQEKTLLGNFPGSSEIQKSWYLTSFGTWATASFGVRLPTLHLHLCLPQSHSPPTQSSQPYLSSARVVLSRAL